MAKLSHCLGLSPLDSSRGGIWPINEWLDSPALEMMSRRTEVYLGLVIAAGSAFLVNGLSHWSTQDWTRYISFCAIALIASGMKVTLPAVPGTISMNFLFVLIGISELCPAGTLGMGGLGILVESGFIAKNRPPPLRVLFYVSCMAWS